MDSKEFVINVRKTIIEENLNIYKNLFNNTKKPLEPYWVDALQLFNKLSIKDKDIFFKIIRQIEVDTVSNIFGILDGSSSLDNQNEDLKLTGVNSTKLINGDLQDLFLELENP
jgi:hypothetical protein